MKWSVGIAAQSDRVLTREQVVELADAVAGHDGIATGIGTSQYGAQLVVEAISREAAIETATRHFTAAAAKAGLPDGPIVRAEAITEEEEEDRGIPGVAATAQHDGGIRGVAPSDIHSEATER